MNKLFVVWRTQKTIKCKGNKLNYDIVYNLKQLFIIYIQVERVRVQFIGFGDFKLLSIAESLNALKLNWEKLDTTSLKKNKRNKLQVNSEQHASGLKSNLI